MTPQQINLLRNNCISSYKDTGNLLDDLKGQSILVTGGTGFMGKWIAEAVAFLNNEYDFKITLYLLARNVEVFRKIVPHLAKHKFIILIEQDVRHISDIPYEVNYVIHAAASPDNREHASQPLRTIDTIYKGTSAVLDACWRLSNLMKFIYISSNNIYGEANGNVNGINEHTIGLVDSSNSNSAYPEAKRLGETICAVYKNQQRLPIIIVRPFTFIGPYQSLDKPWAINNFIRDALLGGPIRILGNEQTKRSYLYGSDMAFWLLKILVAGKPSATYNIGGKEAITMKELAKKITCNFSEKIEVLVKSSKTDNIALSISTPDITTVEKDCSVKQQISLDEAISYTISFNR